MSSFVSKTTPGTLVPKATADKQSNVATKDKPIDQTLQHPALDQQTPQDSVKKLYKVTRIAHALHVYR